MSVDVSVYDLQDRRLTVIAGGEERNLIKTNGTDTY